MDQHYIHSDNPTGTEPYRPGRFCGPGCDLFEDPEVERLADAEAMDEAERDERAEAEMAGGNA